MIRKPQPPPDPGLGVRKSAFTFDSNTAQRTLVPEDGKWLEFAVSHRFDLGQAEHLNQLKARYPAIVRKYAELTGQPGVKSATVWCLDVGGRKFFVIITRDARDTQSFHAFDAQSRELP